MRSYSRVFLSLVVTMLAMFTGVSVADEGHHEHMGMGNAQLGKVVFPISCNRNAQDEFERGLAMLHSFWYEEAGKAFSAAATADPKCAMAYWGTAMDSFHQLWDIPAGALLEQGRAAAEKARSLSAESSSREKDYIQAINLYFQDAGKLDPRSRLAAYSAAMKQIYERYPQDREAAIFYALSLIAEASPKDKTYGKQKEAGAILQKVFAEQPQHPGVAHYLIHAYDYPPLAPLALDAARRYASIAPAVPHALHMPSHIFTRVGMWQDSIASNTAAKNAALKYEADTHMKGAWDQKLHAMDYLVYAELQSGRQNDARQNLADLNRIETAQPPSLVAAYAMAAIPARCAVEAARWKDAATLEPRTTTFPQVDGITYLAKTLGAAHSGDVAAAQSSLEKLQTIHAGLVSSKDDYWAEQVDIQIREATGWIALAQGHDAEALQQLRSAADLEDSTDKLNITPGSIVPAREMLAGLLLELKQPQAALAEYEAVLSLTPRRLTAVNGAAHSAQFAGNKQKAQFYYHQLLEIAAQADPNLPQVDAAKAYLSGAQVAGITH